MYLRQSQAFFSCVDKPKVIHIIITSFISVSYVNSSPQGIEGPMENYRKRVLFLFLSVFFIAFGVSARAETVEEKKEAANYDETLPAPEEAQGGDFSLQPLAGNRPQ